MDSLIKLLGFAPDADPTIIGVLTNCSGVVPSFRGMKGAPSPAAVNMATLAATCMGAALLTKLDTTTRLFAGAPTKVYEAGTSTWTDVSRAAAYTTATTGRWRFAQQANVSFAANGADTVQASASSGAFSCIGGAPIADIVEVVGKFVFAIKTSTNAHGLQWSALNDYTNWSASVATQAGSDTLTSAEGPNTAGRRFGSALVVYKRTSMFIGVNVGPPTVWEFQQIPGRAGALSQEVVVNIGTPENPKHIIMGDDDFFVYDGSKPIPIGTNRIKNYVYSRLIGSRYYACTSLHDRKNSLVYFYYPVSDSVIPDHCVVYNYRTDQWGVDDRKVEATVDYVAGAVTYDALGGLYATYSDFPNIAYDLAFLGSTVSQPAIFNTSHVVQALTGPAGTTSITTGDYGDDDTFSLLDRVRPRFLTAPVAATMTNYYRNNLGDSLSTDTTTPISGENTFDLTREARWHRIQFDFVGDWEMPALSASWEDTGNE